jgi:hypothetical protein
MYFKLQLKMHFNIHFKNASEMHFKLQFYMHFLKNATFKMHVKIHLDLRV